jgi:hypothetical protein
MNDLDPIGALKIQKPKFGVRKPKGNDIKQSNPLETKPHISLVALKAPMLKIPIAIVKNKNHI